MFCNYTDQESFEQIIRGIKGQFYLNFDENSFNSLKTILGQKQLEAVLDGYESEPFDIWTAHGIWEGPVQYARLKVTLTFGCGVPAWGAEEDKTYYILNIQKVMEVLKQ